MNAMFDAFLDELQKISKVIDTPSLQRSQQAHQGRVETAGIHRGDMYGEAPLLPKREPSPTKPLEKGRGRAHPKSV